MPFSHPELCMRRTVAGIALAGLALAACGKSQKAKLAEVQNCSAITLDAAGISRCLAEQYRWSGAEAAATAQARQRELDSISAQQRDSLWKMDVGKHHTQLVTCASQNGDVGRCLTDQYGWDSPHAAVAFDSVWRRQAPRHMEEMRACQRRIKERLGSCLMLYYKWDPKHALALDDSIARARFNSPNHR
jgi:hypothetical protein